VHTRRECYPYSLYVRGSLTGSAVRCDLVIVLFTRSAVPTTESGGIGAYVARTNLPKDTYPYRVGVYVASRERGL
jgi:hypothetical protein